MLKRRRARPHRITTAPEGRSCAPTPPSWAHRVHVWECMVLISDTYDYDGACECSVLIDVMWSWDVPPHVRAQAHDVVQSRATEWGVVVGEMLADAVPVVFPAVPRGRK